MQGSPIKGAARKKNQPTMGGVCDNDDSADDSSYDLSDSPGSDDVVKIMNTHLSDISDDQDDDSDNYEPPEDEQVDDDENNSLLNFLSFVSSLGADDNSNSPLVATTKEADQPKKKKSLGVNAPKLTSACEELGFFNKESVAKYDINGDGISFINKLNNKEPIINISYEVLDVKERMDDLGKTYQSQIKAAGNDTTQEHN